MNDLSKSLARDLVAAVVSSAVTSPFISVIDKAIFLNASGVQTISNSLKSSVKLLVQTPRIFFTSPSFLWIWVVYGSTYSIANTAETLSRHYEKPVEITKFVASSVTNVSLSMAKDRYFTMAFGSGSARPVPLTSLALYATRDSSTILASFILPPRVGSMIEESFGLSATVSYSAAQLATPCLMQLASTPLHLYGMDLYNHPAKLLSSRVTFIKKEYWRTVAARMGRILPAFGFGGLVNKSIRKSN